MSLLSIFNELIFLDSTKESASVLPGMLFLRLEIPKAQEVHNEERRL
jgi:hypothetical protein